MNNDYSQSISLSGDKTLALQAAMAILTSQGFAIVSREKSCVEFRGSVMNSTRQPPITGASAIQVSVAQGQLALNAELGGVTRMRRFLIWFPPGLAAVLSLTLAAVGLGMGQAFGVGFGAPIAAGWNFATFGALACLLAVSPWIVISPLLIRSMRARTLKALDDCLANIDTMSRG